jgi:hypothetical protein
MSWPAQLCLLEATDVLVTDPLNGVEASASGNARGTCER